MTSGGIQAFVAGGEPMRMARHLCLVLLVGACVSGCDAADDPSLDGFGAGDARYDGAWADLPDAGSQDVWQDRPAPGDVASDLPGDGNVTDPGQAADSGAGTEVADDPGPLGDPGPADVGAQDPGPVDPGTADPDVPITPVPFTCGSGTVKDGWNQNWTVAGKNRSFYARFPTNPDNKPVAVLFVYHGQGDNVDNFRKFFNPDPNADAAFPYVLIYPKSLALMPYGTDKGIEWDILKSASGDGNLDARLFEEILGCLGTTVTVDTDNVFVLGFSAGAIFSNLLHARYPDLLPTVFSMSGAWFNDAKTVSEVNTMGMATLSWAALANGSGTVFMTHGGKNDTYGSMGITIIDFEKAAQNALPHLKSKGRTVIDCPHDAGHTNHPQIPIAAMVRFFKDHRGGGSSPYLTDGLPAVFPATCSVIAPQ